MSATRGRRAALAALLAASGLGVAGLSGLTSAAQATTAAPQGISCSTYSTPSLDVAPVRVSQLTDGVPYVMVCVDQQGHETTNNVFIYGNGATP